MPTQRIYDSTGGVVSTVTYDDQAKTTTYAQYQDLEPYFEHNKKLASEANPYICGGDLRRVASVPNVLFLKWCREAGLSPLDVMRKPRSYSKWLRSKIYNTDNSFVLTAPHKRA